MYHIAICDDEPDFVAGIADQIRTLTAQSNIPCRISTYFEPAQLYDALCASQDEIHLVLLDILMGEGDGGMRLAARLREMGNQVSIILVSSSPDFILQGYDVRQLNISSSRCLLRICGLPCSTITATIIKSDIWD